MRPMVCVLVLLNTRNNIHCKISLLFQHIFICHTTFKISKIVHVQPMVCGLVLLNTKKYHISIEINLISVSNAFTDVFVYSTNFKIHPQRVGYRFLYIVDYASHFRLSHSIQNYDIGRVRPMVYSLVFLNSRNDIQYIVIYHCFKFIAGR